MAAEKIIITTIIADIAFFMIYKDSCS